MKSDIAGLKRELHTPLEGSVWNLFADTELKDTASPPENILGIQTTVWINLIAHTRSLATGIDLEGV